MKVLKESIIVFLALLLLSAFSFAQVTQVQPRQINLTAGNYNISAQEINASLNITASYFIGSGAALRDVNISTFEENVTIIVSSGGGTGQTSKCCPNKEITRVHVFPTTSTNRYFFNASSTDNKADIVDSNRTAHTGNWIVSHKGVTILTGNITFQISGATINENITVGVRYK